MKGRQAQWIDKEAAVVERNSQALQLQGLALVFEVVDVEHDVPCAIRLNLSSITRPEEDRDPLVAREGTVHSSPKAAEVMGNVATA